jgi:hypothetical protein
VAKEFVKEVTGREAKSVLKEGWEHHNLFGVGMSSPVTGCHCSMIREKVVHDKFVNLTFIYYKWLKKVRVWGSHDWGKALLRWGISTSKEMEIARKEEENGDGVRNG